MDCESRQRDDFECDLKGIKSELSDFEDSDSETSDTNHHLLSVVKPEAGYNNLGHYHSPNSTNCLTNNPRLILKADSDSPTMDRDSNDDFECHLNEIKSELPEFEDSSDCMTNDPETDIDSQSTICPEEFAKDVDGIESWDYDIVLNTDPDVPLPIKDEPTDGDDFQDVNRLDFEYQTDAVPNDTTDVSLGDDRTKKSVMNSIDRSHEGDGRSGLSVVAQNQQRNFLCTTCGKSFARSSDLKRHARIHTGERPFVCPKCNADFCDRSALKCHLRTHLPVSLKQSFLCPTCGKRFSRSNDLTRHIKIHTGDKPWVCTTCNARFRGRSDLKSHMTTHTGERPFMCHTCDMRFTRSWDLKRHNRRTHSEEQPNVESSKVESHIDTITENQSLDFPAYNSKFDDSSDFDHVTNTEEQPVVSTSQNGGSPDSSEDKHDGKTHTEGKQQSVTCPICNKKFSRSRDVKRHLKTHSNERLFVCSYCTKEFCDSGDLSKHIRTHTREKSHECPTCDKGFTHLSDPKRHLGTPNQPTERSSPSDVYNESSNVESHINTITEDQSFNCLADTSKVDDPNDLERHHITNTEEQTVVSTSQDGGSPDSSEDKNDGKQQSVMCPICNKNFSRSRDVKRHLKTHSSERLFVCSYCSKGFCDSGNLKKHIRTHTGERSHECPTCDKGFTHLSDPKRHLGTPNQPTERSSPSDVYNESSNVESHIDTITEDQSFDCPADNSKFDDASDLDHVTNTEEQLVVSTSQNGGSPDSSEDKNDGKQQSVTCPICHKNFSRSRDVKRHLKTHSSERLFVCSYCTKGFCDSGNLKKHIRTHTGEKSHERPTCDKGFTHLSDPKRHLGTHNKPIERSSPSVEYHEDKTRTRGQPFLCPVCNKGFSRARDVKRHQYTHTTKRPHVCPHCKKGFCDPGNLKKHIRTHTGERPFVCPTCDKGFFDASNLKGHMRTHENLRPYVCPTCNKGLSRASDLKRHLKTHT